MFNKIYRNVLNINFYIFIIYLKKMIEKLENDCDNVYIYIVINL